MDLNPKAKANVNAKRKRTEFVYPEIVTTLISAHGYTPVLVGDGEHQHQPKHEFTKIRLPRNVAVVMQCAAQDTFCDLEKDKHLQAHFKDAVNIAKKAFQMDVEELQKQAIQEYINKVTAIVQNNDFCLYLEECPDVKFLTKLEGDMFTGITRQARKSTSVPPTLLSNYIHFKPRHMKKQFHVIIVYTCASFLDRVREQMTQDRLDPNPRFFLGKELTSVPETSDMLYTRILDFAETIRSRSRSSNSQSHPHQDDEIIQSSRLSQIMSSHCTLA